MWITAGTMICAEDVSRFERTAALLSPRDKETKLSSAFFVRNSDRTYLLTARHSSLETNRSTEVLLPVKEPATSFQLVDASKPAGGDPWKLHRSADLALCEIDLEKLSEDHRKLVEQISLPIEQLDCSPVELSTRVECHGFPLGLGSAVARGR